MNIYQYPGDFFTEGGQLLPDLKLAYTTSGRLNQAKNNVVWVFHALTANSNPAEWWPGMIGENRLIDPENDFVICVNMPGSCYGSSGPLDTNSSTGRPWYHEFPVFTILDMIKAYQGLRDQLGISAIKLAIGGSTGGMQALEWAVFEPEFIQNLVLIATNARHSPWGIAFNTSQRMAIEADQTWKNRDANAGMEGMKVARSIALISYRSYEAYLDTQAETNAPITAFRAESYQKYQGEKLAQRFNAFSYYALSRTMDAHHVGRNRGGIEKALAAIKAKTLVIGIKTDQLFPPSEQEYLARLIPQAALEIIDSRFGHDGFLLEFEKLSKIIKTHLTL
jgi:homoserine O-acetyltransferase/O-succinyltransferase